MTPSIKTTVERLRAVDEADCFDLPRVAHEALREAADLIERLAGALEKIDSQLTNAQPHIATIAERYGPEAAAYVDTHIDVALETARAALSGKDTP